MAKQLRFESEARESLKQGVVKLAKAVKSTLGPRGRTAVIDRGWGGPTITKDGYSVADEVDLSDKYENLGAQLLKEAASKTHDASGDGTTTATVLAEAIFINALRHLGVGANTAAINRGIMDAVERVKTLLRDKAVKVSLDQPERLMQIASIAANNDKDLGRTLIDALKRVGKDGVINIEEGKGTETSVKVVEGMQFDRGYLSPHFATDQKTLECEYRNCLVLIHEDKITSIKKLIPLLEKASKAKKQLLIIAEDVEGEALATLVVNKLRGVVDSVAGKAPAPPPGPAAHAGGVSPEAGKSDTVPAGGAPSRQPVESLASAAPPHGTASSPVGRPTPVVAARELDTPEARPRQAPERTARAEREPRPTLPSAATQPAHPAGAPKRARSEAEAYERKGHEAAKAGRWRDAIAAWLVANDLSPKPSTLLNVARGYLRLGSPGRACVYLQRYERAVGTDVPATAAALIVEGRCR